MAVRPVLSDMPYFALRQMVNKRDNNRVVWLLLGCGVIFCVPMQCDPLASA
jgi:hypothetical protein